MTLPLEQSMEGGRAKPIEEMAEALRQSFRESVAELSGLSFEATGVTMPGGEGWNRYAKAAFACLVSHGFITIEGLLAMKAEQEAGE